MKYLKFQLFALAIASIAMFTSCDKDEKKPIPPGTTVTVTNTFQSDAFTNGTETAIEDLFSVPAGSLAATATTSDGLEFDNYLLNLYDINIGEKSISFDMVAEAGDPTYGDLFRTLEAGTVDRYYFNFAEGHNVDDWSSNNSSVNLRIDSGNILVVEIGEGYDFNPGISFTISLRR